MTETQSQLQQQPTKTTTAPSTPPLVVGVIVFTDVVLLDFVGTTSYLGLLPKICNVPIEVHTVSQKQGPLRSVEGVPLYASVGYEDAPTKLDILLIPGGPGIYEMYKDQDFLHYIHNVAEQSTYVLTVCTGAGVLAQSGFLDGKRATTNKLEFGDLVRDHPNVSWVYKARWLVSGNLWTSSGVSAGMDMAYAFVSSVYGSKAADEIAKILEVEPSKDASNDPFAVVHE